MVKNTDFNFENFTVAAIKAIDEIRSNGINGLTSSTESRINAFYRSLGLPAIRSKNVVLDSFNTGNLFASSSFSSDELEQNKLLDKLNIRKLDFIKPLTEEEIQTFTTNNRVRLKENLGVEGENQTSESSKRLRGVMLPMVVDGNIPIFPQSKRVAGAFKLDEELIIDRNTYKRPLIETIISMRLKSQGAQNSQTQSNVNSDLTGQEVLDFNNIGESIGGILELSTYNIDELIYKAILETVDAKKNFNNKEIVPTIANIAEQRPTIRAAPLPAKLGKAEVKKLFQQEKDEIKRAILSIFEYDDTFASDVSNKRNLKGSILGSILLDVVNPQEENAEREEKEIDKQEDKETTRLVKAYRSLDLVFGQFSGIAGTDIIIVLTAMFQVELRFLVGLLNDEAKERLLAFGLGADNLVNTSLIESLSALEAKVTELYDRISTGINQYKHKDKKTNQRRQGRS